MGSRALSGHGAGDDPDGGSLVLATVGDAELTEADVESARPADFLRLKQQAHDLTSQALESAILNELVRLEAEARDMEPADLLAEEVDGRIDDPSDEEISAFYQERGLQGQGSLELLAPQISAYLRDQSRNARHAAFLAILEARYPVERRLDPLRIAVASEGFPSKGPKGAPVTLVEFSDFQCPYCRVLQSALDQVEETYGDQVRFVFRQFPLTSIHPQANDAAEASLCANAQGMFWEMHDALFANQRALQVDQLKATAREIGLDGAEFDECMDFDRYAFEVFADSEAGSIAGVQGTPMIFINGRALSGAKPFEEISAIIDDELRRSGK
jgi:protein-disulfide isomerase